ncbi:MAG: DUF2282 domain-containing protein [Oligoflexus sp.]
MKEQAPKLWHLALAGIFSASAPALAKDEQKKETESGQHEHMMKAPDGMEKCVGIVRKGSQNSCATDTHACAGMIPADSPQDELGYYENEWRWVKKGSCEDIQKSIAARKEKAAKPAKSK